MKINNISKIDNKKGDFIVLSDYGMEGISVTSQHKTIEEAIQSLGESHSPQSIVKLVDVTIEVVN